MKNSCLPQDNDYLDLGLALLPEQLEDKGFDWRILYMTASPYDTEYFEVTSEDPWESLNALDYVRTYGREEEAPIDKLMNFHLSESTWFRKNSEIVHMILTDEADQSINYTTSDLQGRALYSIGVIGIPEDNPCGADRAPSIELYVDQVENICIQSSWSILD